MTTKNQLPDYNEMFKECSKSGDKMVSKILGMLLRENFKEFIVSILLFLVKHCPVWVIPIVTANVINVANHPESYKLSTLFINGGLLCLLIVQNIFTHTLFIKYSSSMLRGIGAGLRNSLIKKLQQLSISYQNELESGKLQTKFIRDVETIENFLNQIMSNLIPCITTLLITVAITLSKNLTISAFFALLIPANIAVVRLFRKRINKSNKVFRREVENVSSQMTTMIDMIPVTKAHGLENVEIKKLESDISHLKSTGLSLDKSNALFGSTTWVVSMLCNAICLTFTGVLAYLGKMEIGDVVLFQTYFSTITGNVQGLINIFPEFVKGTESIRSVSEIMISDRVENNKGKINLRYVHGSVEFNNVSFKYPNADDYVIKNFSLNVVPGDCVAFVGASGSGKSTIMNMIIGFLRATNGHVKVDGKSMEYLNLSAYRHFLSVVPQNCILFQGSIRDNITYGMNNVSEERLMDVVELANINEFVDKLPNGLDTEVGERGGNLSGGQKQRISIARALIRDPRIIIFDEATSALDNVSEFHVQQAMSKLIKGRTTFIVAHRLSTIRDANKIVVMDKGQCVEFGTYNELMDKKGKFYELKHLSEME